MTTDANWPVPAREAPLGQTIAHFALEREVKFAVPNLSRVEERFGEDVLLPETLYDDARLASLAKAVEDATASAGSSA